MIRITITCTAHNIVFLNLNDYLARKHDTTQNHVLYHLSKCLWYCIGQRSSAYVVHVPPSFLTLNFSSVLVPLLFLLKVPYFFPLRVCRLATLFLFFLKFYELELHKLMHWPTAVRKVEGILCNFRLVSPCMGLYESDQVLEIEKVGWKFDIIVMQHKPMKYMLFVLLSYSCIGALVDWS